MTTDDNELLSKSLSPEQWAELRARFDRLLARVELKFPVPLKLVLTAPGVVPVALTVVADVNDIRTGQPAKGHTSSTLPPYLVTLDASDADLLNFARDLLVFWAKHEIEETFLLDGSQAYHPRHPWDDKPAVSGHCGECQRPESECLCD
jgi:hypothetical protein